VVSRHATRHLLINGDKRQLVWDWDEQGVRLFDPASGKWEAMGYSHGVAAAGYNTNLGEAMYIEELRNFLDAVQGQRRFVNTLENDGANLRLLYAIEQADRTSRYVLFTP